jgi:transcriptional regulator of heat shock response
MHSSEAAASGRLLALAPYKYSSDSKLKSLQNTEKSTLADSSEYIKKFLDSLCVDIYVQGNMNLKNTLEFSGKIKEKFSLYNEVKGAVDMLKDAANPKQVYIYLCVSRHIDINIYIHMLGINVFH